MPLHAWLISKNVKQYYYELSKTQWLPREKILELQLKKLKLLLEHAYLNVPYYREVFASLNLTPSDIRSLDDLQMLPLLSKDIISKNLYFEMLSRNHDKKAMLKIVTSGSTGTPFTCYADKFQLEMRWAATLRSMEWTGYVFGDKCVRLWHQTIGMSPIQVFREKFDAILSRRKFIPAFSISNTKIHAYMKKIEKYKPVLIDGYAESLNFLANYMRVNGGLKIKPKAVLSSAQILPDQSRKAIEEFFYTSVFDKYGSREFSGIAYESPSKDGHLIVAENYIVELITNNRKSKPGEIGEVVITDLNNYSMPHL
jgi:phenylacetate-CoA ligase